MAELHGDSETAAAGVTGTGFMGVEGKGLPGGIGVLGARVTEELAASPAGFVAVKGDAGKGFAGPGGVPVGAPLIGVLGIVSSPSGAAVQGVNDQGTAGQFNGTVFVDGQLHVSGDVNVTGDVVLKNRDLAERFALDLKSSCHPGMVMVIDPSGLLTPCCKAYDKRVAGVVSGAHTLKPAITLGEFDDGVPNAAIALAGTVCCHVDADIEPIETGDLLTSSPTVGHAMKATDPSRTLGSVIGKALAPLSHGRGYVPMLIALQ